MVVIGGFRSDLLITRKTTKTDENFGNVSTGVLFSIVAYQRKWWQIKSMDNRKLVKRLTRGLACAQSLNKQLVECRAKRELRRER